MNMDRTPRSGIRLSDPPTAVKGPSPGPAKPVTKHAGWSLPSTRYRHPGDVIRLIGSGLVLIVLLAAVAVAPGRSRRSSPTGWPLTGCRSSPAGPPGGSCKKRLCMTPQGPGPGLSSSLDEGAGSYSGGVAAQAPDGAGHEDREPYGQVQDPAPLNGAAVQRVVDELAEPVQRRELGEGLQIWRELAERDEQAGGEGAQRQREPNDLGDVLRGQQVAGEQAEGGEQQGPDLFLSVRGHSDENAADLVGVGTHSAVPVNEWAPTSTAHTARPEITPAGDAPRDVREEREPRPASAVTAPASGQGLRSGGRLADPAVDRG